MRKAIISLILLITPALVAAQPAAMQESAPERYTVQRGDTLWSISGRYLKEPWRWPELWKMNQEQLKNPHLIYPGDTIVLDRSSGEPRLSLVQLDTTKLEPRVRSEPSASSAVPSILPTVIEPFLSKPLVVGVDELEDAPKVIATADGRVTLGPGDRAFVHGLNKDKGNQWQVFRRGDPLIDPENNEILGYEAIYLGETQVVQHGNVATVEIVRSVQEIHRNDRLLPLGKQTPVFAYVPQPPTSAVKGRIISAYGGLQETGPLSIVTLSRGSKDGLRVGTVLAIERSQTSARYSQRTAPLFGRSGPSGSDAPRPYYGEAMPPREVLLDRGERITNDDIAQLPDQRYGLVMVFRTFERVSYALVMEASRPVAVSDYVTNP